MIRLGKMINGKLPPAVFGAETTELRGEVSEIPEYFREDKLDTINPVYMSVFFFNSYIENTLNNGLAGKDIKNTRKWSEIQNDLCNISAFLMRDPYAIYLTPVQRISTMLNCFKVDLHETRAIYENGLNQRCRFFI